MKPIFTFVFLALMPASLAAQDTVEAAQSPLEMQVFGVETDDLQKFVWKNRPIIVLADSPEDPRFIEQMALLRERIGDLAERDVVVLTDTDPAANSALRDRLHPRGFMLVLIGKDGTIKLRKPFPWDVRELSRSIDKMPMRQQEIRDRRGRE